MVSFWLEQSVFNLFYIGTCNWFLSVCSRFNQYALVENMNSTNTVFVQFHYPYKIFNNHKCSNANSLIPIPK